MHKRPIKLVIVDDDKFAPTAARLLLRRDRSITLVGIASSAAEGREIIRDLRPDVVVVDWLLGDGDGVRLIAEVRRELPGLHAVLISAYPSFAMIDSADKAGIRGVLDKLQLDFATLRAAVLTVAAGAHYDCPSILDLRRRGRVAALPYVSTRQREILDRLARYETRVGIAAALHVRPSTITQHLNRMAAKLSLPQKPSTAELITAARAAGLLPRIPSRGPDAR